MDLRNRILALYGRFSPGLRDELVASIASRGGRVIRDLTERGDILVVGGMAHSLIASGALPARLEIARRGGKAIFSEDVFRSLFAAADARDAPTLPIATALAQSGANDSDADLLAAFGLINLGGDKVRFGDVAMLKTAAALRGAACTQTAMIRALLNARRSAPAGRYKVVIIAVGEPALEWEDGLTTLEGQGFLPLDLGGGNQDDLFEAAEVAESEDRLADALHLYDTCAGVDREDAISLYNIGNLHLRQGDIARAALTFRRALGRDGYFIEARYNLTLALEALGSKMEAESELRVVLAHDPDHADAHFNQAQLILGAGKPAEARDLFELYLTLDPPAEWAAKARRAILLCAMPN